ADGHRVCPDVHPVDVACRATTVPGARRGAGIGRDRADRARVDRGAHRTVMTPVETRVLKEAFVRQRYKAFWCVVVVLFSFAGCGYRKGNDSYDTIDDEALRYYAKSGHRTPDQAAYDYLPQRIDNYFQGMDGIVEP